MATRDSIPDNELVEGSRWFPVYDNVTGEVNISAFDRLITAFLQWERDRYPETTTSKQKQRRRDACRLKHACISCWNKETKRWVESDGGCNFGITATKKLGDEFCRLIKLNLSHDGKDCKEETQRQKRTKLTHQQGAGVSTVLSSLFLVGSTNQKRQHTKELQEELRREDQVRLSKDQVGKFVRQHKQNDWIDHIIEYTQLPDYIARLRAADPNGIYLLQTRPLSYSLEGFDVPDGAREFIRMVIYPSSHLTFWKNCRRIATLDCSHLRGRFSGAYQALCTLDANQQNFTIGYEVVSAETKENYDALFDMLEVILPKPILVMITDKFKGLTRRIQDTNTSAASSIVPTEIVSAQRIVMEAEEELVAATEHDRQLWDKWAAAIRDPYLSAETKKSLRDAHNSASDDVMSASDALQHARNNLEALRADLEASDSLEDIARMIWHNCVLHVGRNCSIGSRQGKFLITQCAKAPTDESLSEWEAKLRHEVGDIKTAEFMSHKDEWSTARKFQIHACLETLLDAVTNNTSEQGNSTFLDFRELPILTALRQWLFRHAEYIAHRQPQADVFVNAGERVVQRWRKQVQMDAKATAMTWKATVISFNYGSGTASFIVHKKEQTEAESKTYQVSIDINSSIWYKAAFCTCGYTRSRGYPCRHASFILVKLRFILESHLGSASLPENMNIADWLYVHPRYYHTAFHVSSYRAQYGKQSLLPIVQDKLSQYCLLPPFQFIDSGRSKKERATSASDYRSSKAKRTDSTNVDHELRDSSFMTDVLTDLPQYIQEEESSSSAKRPRGNCTVCTQPGHDARSCPNMSTVTILRKHGPFLKKLLQFPTMSSYVAEDLSALPPRRVLNALIPREIQQVHDVILDDCDSVTSSESDDDENLDGGLPDDQMHSTEGSASTRDANLDQPGTDGVESGDPALKSSLVAEESEDIEVGDLVVLQSSVVPKYFGARGRNQQRPSGKVVQVSKRNVTIEWAEESSHGEYSGLSMFSTKRSEIKLM